MQRQAFTLVELMIVVAIIGILAAIAIPNFVEMQYRSKRAEVPSNVDGIRTAEVAYDALYDQYLPAAQAPTSDPGKSTVDWTNPTDWKVLGWTPDGAVRGAYEVTTTPGVNEYTITGIADVDGDNVDATYTATSTVEVTQVTAANVY